MCGDFHTFVARMVEVCLLFHSYPICYTWILELTIETIRKTQLGFNSFFFFFSSVYMFLFDSFYLVQEGWNHPGCFEVCYALEFIPTSSWQVLRKDLKALEQNWSTFPSNPAEPSFGLSFWEDCIRLVTLTLSLPSKADFSWKAASSG